MGRKSREKKERRQSKELINAASCDKIIRSISFRANKDGKLEFLDKFQAVGHRVRPSEIMPNDFHKKLMDDIVDDEERELFLSMLQTNEHIFIQRHEAFIAHWLARQVNELMAVVFRNNPA